MIFYTVSFETISKIVYKQYLGKTTNIGISRDARGLGSSTLESCGFKEQFGCIRNYWREEHKTGTCLIAGCQITLF